MADPRIKATEVILDGSVYDLEAFSKVHPGGKEALVVFGGSDATTHYFMLHQHPSLHKALEPYKLRAAPPPAGMTAAMGNSAFLINTQEFRDLKMRVRKAIPKQFATVEWYIKATGIMALALYLECHSLAYGFSLFKSIFLGVIFAMIGLCIQHDANHGAVSRNGTVNRLWGYTQDWIGGSALLWKHHHVLMHHAETNVTGDDPDATSELIRFNKLTTWKGHHKWQALYTWLLLPLLPINWHFKELGDLINMSHMKRPISEMARGERNIAIVFRIFFLMRFYIVPLWMYPSFHTVGCLFASLAAGGGYLGINFIISHNFEGVRHVLQTPDRADHKKRDWSFEQVETSSTVGGRWLGYLHGGLNYQIEHHLFPRISHVHYHILAPVVKQWCKEHKLRYSYYNNLAENIASTYKHLSVMSVPPEGAQRG